MSDWLADSLRAIVSLTDSFFIFVSWSQHGGALTLLQLSRRCFPSILRTCRRVLNESTLSHSFVPDKPCLNGKGIHCLPTKYLVIVIPQWNDLSGLQIPTSETCRKPKGHSLRGNLSSRLLLCLPHACVGHGSLLRLVSRQSEVQWFFCYPGMALGADYAHLIRSLLCSKMGRFQMFWGLLIWNVKLRCKKTCVNMMFGRSPMAFFGVEFWLGWPIQGEKNPLDTMATCSSWTTCFLYRKSWNSFKAMSFYLVVPISFFCST